MEGFRIDMTGEEILRHLGARIHHHESAAADSDRKRVQLEATLDPDDEDMELVWPGYSEERQAARHKRRVAALLFLRDHVVAHEIYRLGHADLRLLEVGPDALQASTDRRGRR